jgi:hypothetical protein
LSLPTFRIDIEPHFFFPNITSIKVIKCIHRDV